MSSTAVHSNALTPLSKQLPDSNERIHYAKFTYAAKQEGEIGVIGDEPLEVLNDNDAYWWLVRPVNSTLTGYVPADIIETPNERTARLNKEKNMEGATTNSSINLVNKKMEAGRKKSLDLPRRVHIAKQVKVERIEYVSNLNDTDTDEEIWSDDLDAEEEKPSELKKRQNTASMVEKTNTSSIKKWDNLKFEKNKATNEVKIVKVPSRKSSLSSERKPPRVSSLMNAQKSMLVGTEHSKPKTLDAFSSSPPYTLKKINPSTESSFFMAPVPSISSSTSHLTPPPSPPNQERRASMPTTSSQLDLLSSKESPATSSSSPKKSPPLSSVHPESRPRRNSPRFEKRMSSLTSSSTIPKDRPPSPSTKAPISKSSILKKSKRRSTNPFHLSRYTSLLKRTTFLLPRSKRKSFTWTHYIKTAATCKRPRSLSSKLEKALSRASIWPRKDSASSIQSASTIASTSSAVLNTSFLAVPVYLDYPKNDTCPSSSTLTDTSSTPNTNCTTSSSTSYKILIVSNSMTIEQVLKQALLKYQKYTPEGGVSMEEWLNSWSFTFTWKTKLTLIPISTTLLFMDELNAYYESNISSSALSLTFSSTPSSSSSSSSSSSPSKQRVSLVNFLHSRKLSTKSQESQNRTLKQCLARPQLLRISLTKMECESHFVQVHYQEQDLVTNLKVQKNTKVSDVIEMAVQEWNLNSEDEHYELVSMSSKKTMDLHEIITSGKLGKDVPSYFIQPVKKIVKESIDLIQKLKEQEIAQKVAKQLADIKEEEEEEEEEGKEDEEVFSDEEDEELIKKANDNVEAAEEKVEVEKEKVEIKLQMKEVKNEDLIEADEDDEGIL